jgi:PAS domain S-box-containing protein
MKTELTKVLLIEDDPFYAQALKDLMTAHKELFELELADGLTSGLKRLSEGEIDLVLLDLSLPDSDGMVTVRRVCDHSPQIPVIVLTACDDEEIGLQAVQSGAQDYLVKDQIDFPLLRRAMRYAIERKRGELALRESQTKLQLIADSTPEIIALFDLNERKLAYVNRQVQKILGYSPEQLQQTPLSSLAHPDDLAKLAEIYRGMESLKLGEVIEAVYRVRHANGEWRWLSSEITVLLHSEENGVLQALGATRDITEKKRLEDQFLRMQRLESIGALASGIAHDLNNWLAPIMLSLHTLQQRFTDANSQKWLSLIRKSAERSRDLIDQVLTFAKGTAGERAPLGTSNIIADVAKIVREVVPGNISLDLDLPENLWSVIGDATQVHQVMMNLCINARDAMPEGGNLLIAAANQVLGPGFDDDVWVSNGVKPGRFVQISVIDTGIGMTPELMDRAFEPFFTTKENGLGSGLGLSTALGIVRSHGGFINVSSSVGKGSQFRVYLPATENKPESLPDEKEEAPPAGHGELILVVDDEMEAREVTRATLEFSGYRTLGARDGQEALTLYSQHRDEIELVVTNFLLPHQDGVSLGGALRRLNPRLGIIVTSGLHSQEQIEAANRAGIRTILWKPYTAQQLLNAMANNLM